MIHPQSRKFCMSSATEILAWEPPAAPTYREWPWTKGRRHGSWKTVIHANDNANSIAQCCETRTCFLETRTCQAPAVTRLRTQSALPGHRTAFCLLEHPLVKLPLGMHPRQHAGVEGKHLHEEGKVGCINLCTRRVDALRSRTRRRQA